MNQKQALQTFGRSGNPMFSDQTFSEKIIDVSLPKMTLQGTVNKVGMSLLLVLLTAAYTWNQYFSYGADAIGALTIGGSLVGFVFALITIFKRTWAPVTAPLYALAKGFALGGISAMYEAQFSGITIQAVTLTFATMFGLLFAYKTGIIKPDQNFRLMLFSATATISWFPNRAARSMISMWPNVNGSNVPGYILMRGVMAFFPSWRSLRCLCLSRHQH